MYIFVCVYWYAYVCVCLYIHMYASFCMVCLGGFCPFSPVDELNKFNRCFIFFMGLGACGLRDSVHTSREVQTFFR